MSSLKSTPRQIVTNLFFALNLPSRPLMPLPFPSRLLQFPLYLLPFPSRPCHSPHALKGQKLLAQGIALGIHVRTPGALKGQKLYMTPRI